MVLVVKRKPAAKRSAAINSSKPSCAKRTVARVRAKNTTLKRPAAKRPAAPRRSATIASSHRASHASHSGNMVTLADTVCDSALGQQVAKRPPAYMPPHEPSAQVTHVQDNAAVQAGARIILDQLGLPLLDPHSEASIRAIREQSVLIAAPLLALHATVTDNHNGTHQVGHRRPPFRSFMYHNGFRCTIVPTRAPEACNWTELASDHLLLYLSVQDDSAYIGSAKCHEDTVMFMRCLSRGWMTTFSRWIKPCPPGPFFYNGIWSRTTGGTRTVET